jgi:SWI/SNF-related matrix-associated actin-dependent regulator 1 of chromatin subfamily A
MESVPKYLAEPEREGRHGTVRFDGREFVIEAEPAVLEMCKRVFPGCEGRGGRVRFHATRRAAGDLNWLLLRYPMKVECRAELEKGRAEAIEHALRRETCQALAPVARPAGFRGTLMPFQAEGVPYLTANKRALLADDMGLGKTVQALAAMGEVGEWPVVIVTPPAVQLQWERAAERFLEMPDSITSTSTSTNGGPRVVRVKGMKAERLPAADIYLVHYGLLRAWGPALRELGARVVIFDEIQELRHTGTQKYSEASLLAGESEWVWGLSGTPIYNYGDEMWAVMNILEFQCLGSFESFTREWCTGYGSKIVRKPAALHNWLKREGLMLRRVKADVLEQLPPKRRSVIAIDHDANTFARMAGEAIRLARGYREIEGWHEKGQAARLIDVEARKACGAAKAPWAAEFAATLIEGGERPLIFAYHHEVHRIMRERLAKYGVVTVTGEETPREKDEAVAEFAKGKAKAIELSLRTAAGLDGLQGRGTCVVFAELDWSPAVHAQCEDRLHRIGVGDGLESILCYYLVASTGIDEVMQDALGLKVGQFTGIMGDKAEGEAERAEAERAAARHLESLIAKMSR